MNEKHETLKKLAGGAIERLKQLPQPVVRVSGPLTSGGPNGDYDENLERFRKAQQKLRDEGYTVFDYFDGHDDENVINGLGLPWEEVMLHYHDPILQSGLLQKVFMMPFWEKSNGAKWELKHFIEQGLGIELIPESWFD